MSQSDDNQGLYPVRIDIPPEIRLYVIQLKLGQHILAISGEIRRPGLEGGSPGVWGSCMPRFLLCCIT